jgi:NADH-quinone oxidoreductase subunit G
MTVTAKLDGSPAADLVKATIDGIEVEVPKGTLIIRAAEQIGIHIPRFCDHPLLDKVAACRQCLVEVAMPGPDGTVRTMTMPGSPNVKPQPACAMELTPGMQVKTQHTSPAAEQSQHGVMELLLINHPLDCPVWTGHQPVHRRQAHLPQTDQDLHPGAARPGALHRLPTLHPVHQADRR